jgi:hypothetical protein
VAGFGSAASDNKGDRQIAAGERLTVTATVENRFVPGRYSIECRVSRNRTPGDLALRVSGLVDFVIRGDEPLPGMVSVDADVEASLEP